MVSLSDLIGAHAKLSQSHKRALLWFLEREGTVVPWPDALPDGTFLATKAKGIYKPKDSPYALSVRQTLDGPYPDHDVEYLEDGSWQYRYFQEGLEVAEGARNFTNRGMFECMKDFVPVAVLIQQATKGHVRYLVQGLAFVDDWTEGYFVLAGVPTKSLVSDGVRYEGISTATPAELADLVASAFDPKNIEDARRKVRREVVHRQGQLGFRSVLLDAYGHRCVASGYDASEALEAAHIVPYRGPATNHPSNGLLLRGDLHALFDMGMLAIHEDERVIVLCDELKLTRYGQMHGQPITTPKRVEATPSREALRNHRDWAGL